MAATELAGKIQTVLGPIDPGDLGVTTTHEHLLLDLGCYFELPDEASERGYVDAPLTMDLLSKALSFWSYNRDSHQLFDVDTAIREVSSYKYLGGQSVVDATSIGIGRDPLAFARISRATGLNVIMGGSYYVPVSHPTNMDERTEDDIASEIIRDVTVGVGETGVRSGIIGEVGNFWPTSENELKVLRASARAQQETGAPILVHSGFHPDSLPAIMETLVESGAKPERVIMGHLDIFQASAIESIAETGCYLEFDGFGVEDTSGGRVAHQPIVLPSDVRRMELLEYLVDQGYGDKIVLAQDVCFKFQYLGYGGKGYSHILDSIVPRMRRRGFAEEQIQAFLVDNPRNILTFV